VCEVFYDTLYGMLKIDPETLEIQHEYDDTISGRTLTIANEHSLDPEYLRYHNEKIADT
jgi:hypothetical protein